MFELAKCIITINISNTHSSGNSFNNRSFHANYNTLLDIIIKIIYCIVANYNTFNNEDCFANFSLTSQ